MLKRTNLTSTTSTPASRVVPTTEHVSVYQPLFIEEEEKPIQKDTQAEEENSKQEEKHEMQDIEKQREEEKQRQEEEKQRQEEEKQRQEKQRQEEEQEMVSIDKPLPQTPMENEWKSAKDVFSQEKLPSQSILPDTPVKAHKSYVALEQDSPILLKERKPFKGLYLLQTIRQGLVINAELVYFHTRPLFTLQDTADLAKVSQRKKKRKKKKTINNKQ